MGIDFAVRRPASFPATGQEVTVPAGRVNQNMALDRLISVRFF